MMGIDFLYSSEMRMIDVKYALNKIVYDMQAEEHVFGDFGLLNSEKIGTGVRGIRIEMANSAEELDMIERDYREMCTLEEVDAKEMAGLEDVIARAKKKRGELLGG